MLTKSELIKESQVPRQTLERWLRDKDKPFPPDAFDENGKPLFTPERVAEARARHNPQFNSNKRKKLNENNLGISLFSKEDNIMDITIETESNLEITETSIEPPAQALAVTEEQNQNSADEITAADVTVATASQPTEENHVADDSAKLEEIAGRIRKNNADVQRGIIEIGTDLNEAKKLVPHGQWADWLEKEFDWTQRTANNFMRIADRFGKTENVFLFQTATLQAMLLLPEGDEQAFIEAQADAGHPVENQTARQVKEAVKEWKESKVEVGGEYLNVPGTNKNKPIVEELNASLDAHAPREGLSEASAVPDIPPAENAEIKPPASEDCPAKEKSNDEWYTPPEYADLVRAVFGGTIELDPASCETANQFVRADKFFDKNSDGLKQDWRGKIFLNPPYSKTEEFVDKLLAEYDAGNIKEAIFLTHNKTETDWFARKLEPRAAVMCFPNERINFIPESGVAIKGSSKRGQTFFYFGENPEKFMEVFSNIGWFHQHMNFQNVERKNDDDDI